jgi:hypothetical protein
VSAVGALAGGPAPGQGELRELWRDDEPAPVALSAAGWRLHLRGDTLSDIRWGDRLVLRALRVVVRDRDWGTVPADLEPVEVDAGADGAVVTLRARHRQDDVDFAWSGRLLLQPGLLRFSFEGAALAPFLRNRIGLVLLHPAEAAGTSLTVHHHDGAPTVTAFPRDIAPHQPALDIAGLEWKAGPVHVRARLDGDVFEMEDQRNWTDSSFKTYGTPLDLPFPVRLAPGQRVAQSVVLTCRGDGTSPAPQRAAAVALVPAGYAVPTVTVGAATAPAPPGRRGGPLPWMAGTGVLVELDLATTSWRDALARASEEAGRAALDVRLITDDTAPLAAAVDAIAGLPVARMGVFSGTTHVSEPRLHEALVGLLEARGVTAEVIAGARAHFTELNRTQDRLPAGADAVTFSITPQMHETSRAQVVQSVPVLRLVAEQAVRIADGRPVYVGPVTLRPRFNAVATSRSEPGTARTVEPGYAAEHVPGATDPRQRGAAGAAWLVAAAAALAVPGVAGVCWSEAWGPRGFGEADGRPFPAAEALAWLAAIAGWEVCAVRGTLPPDVGVLAAHREGELVVLAANLGDGFAGVVVDVGPGTTGGVLRRLGREPAALLADGGLLALEVGATQAVRWTARLPVRG